MARVLTSAAGVIPGDMLHGIASARVVRMWTVSRSDRDLLQVFIELEHLDFDHRMVEELDESDLLVVEREL